VSHVEWSTVENSNFNYFFQQAPGDGNALGKIEFYFENPYIVYIHDTNDKGKFRHDIRAFSHGCIRIQEPGEFAKSLLKLEPNPLADSVDNWLTGDTREKVDFAEPIPLFVRYLTCEANENGQITFYQDIYDKDKKMKQALFNINDF
jgi:murein L,D-transpeptidase YcbB/YkuD